MGGLAPWLWSLAHAHPLNFPLVVHHSEVVVLPTAVELRYHVTLPVHDAEQEALLQTLDQLESGLVVTADGRSVTLGLVSQSRVTEGHEHRASLVLRGALPSHATALAISTGNYPFSPSSFSWDVALDRSLVLGDNSLRHDTPRGPHWYVGTPLIGDEYRTLNLQLAHRYGALGPLWSALTPRQPVLVSPQTAARTSPLARLAYREATPLAALLAMVAATLAGAASRRERAAHDVATGACFLTWLVLAAVLTPPTGPALDALGLPLLVGAVAALRQPAWATSEALAAATVATAALATSSGLIGGLTWLCWSLGRSVARERLPTYTLPTLAAGVGLLLIARGLLPHLPA